MPKSLKRILLVGDDYGVDQLLDYFLIIGLIGASVRPQYSEFLSQKAFELGVPFYCQPKFSDSGAYKDFFNSVRALKPDGLICNSYSMLLQEDFCN